MRQLLSLCLTCCLAACFPFDEGPPDASKEQVDAILRHCDVHIQRVELQDQDGGRLLVSIDAAEPEKAAKVKCLDREQEKSGVGFAIFGVTQDPPK